MIIDLIDDAEKACSGGFISWTRLVAELQRSGEVKATETVARLDVFPRGIDYRVVDRVTHRQPTPDRRAR